MTVAVDILSWVLLGAGSIFVVIGGIGIIRMPDFYTRLHPVGVTDTMGAGLILAGLCLQAGFSLVMLKLVLIFIFLMFTSPAASHATARAALAAALPPRLAKTEDEGP